jgi:membrane protease YdiL (CAAX protease family)
MNSDRFERYIAPARPKSQLWRLVLGICVIAIVYLGFVAGQMASAWAVMGASRTSSWLQEMLLAETPKGTILLLTTFIGMALGPMIAVRLVHRRSIGSLFGRSPVVLRDFVQASATVFVIYAVVMLIWSLKYDAVPNLDLWVWLGFLPLALGGILIQTLAEELVFRGYLQQQLAARFKSPIIWMILPALAFGLVHYEPERAGGNVWVIIGAAAVFGLIAADLTRHSGSLGAAWGFHFANNVLAILFLAVDGTIPGLALYLTPYSADDVTQLRGLLGVDIVAMVAAWWVIRRTLRR